MNTPHISPSVERAIRLMEYLGQSSSGASQQELTEALDLSSSTCYRILQTLRNRDWVHQKPDGRHVVSGGILRAAMIVADRATRFAASQPFLERLARETELSCKISIRQGGEQVTVARAESPQPMSVSGRVGARFPVVEGSVGAALLSGETDPILRDLVRECPEKIPESTHPGLLLERIAAVRVTGVCFVDARKRWHTLALSAPVREEGGAVAAAVTLLGFPEDFQANRMPDLTRRLIRTAAACGRLICGGRVK